MDIIDPAVSAYLLEHCTPPDPIQSELREETLSRTGDRSGMQTSQDEAELLAMLVRLTGARFVVEVGVFTGYSSLAMARALPEGGRLLACDVSEEWTSIARRYWERAGVADRIDLRVAPAVETLRTLPSEPSVDLAFIDADKTGYPAYWEEIVPRVRPGGLILLDNVLWSGRVTDPSNQEDNTLAIRQVNDLVTADERVDSLILPVRDGLTLARKRG
ncbi:class I SAM-dependent methyltransferase [Streptomyces sp. NPDC005438]|uniref:O-methyltransferase n=1 Tax=Streptomyces sp. NPDC005438 TaxID=3156880 RepID=UPI0033A3E1CC